MVWVAKCGHHRLDVEMLLRLLEYLESRNDRRWPCSIPAVAQKQRSSLPWRRRTGSRPATRRAPSPEDHPRPAPDAGHPARCGLCGRPLIARLRGGMQPAASRRLCARGRRLGTGEDSPECLSDVRVRVQVRERGGQSLEECGRHVQLERPHLAPAPGFLHHSVTFCPRAPSTIADAIRWLQCRKASTTASGTDWSRQMASRSTALLVADDK